MSIREELDGRNFFYMFYSGARKILEHQQEINRINVFPVPDADTGTNLASTIMAVIDTIKPDRSYKVTTEAIAEAALIGARGNSGVIFAQFLNGINEETTDCKSIGLSEFAETLQNSVRHLYSAVAEPVEGTMLTVIREWSEFIYKHKDSRLDFRSVFIKSLEAAKKSLQETPQKLKVLARANVVDAGAKGFVVFLEGIMEFLNHRNLRLLVSAHRELVIIDEIPEHITGDFTFRFCTEALIKGNGLDRETIEKTVKSYGDSVVIAGTGKLIRIHVHTDEPDVLMEDLRKTGTLAFQKAEDMRKQYVAAYERKWPVALVTDSSCDLPEEILERYQIHMIPLNLFLGDHQYLDKITIKPHQFYTLMNNLGLPTGTSQPSEQSFVNLYSQLATHYESVISVHVSKKLSGTWRSATMAAEKVMADTGKAISVLNGKSLSGGHGLQVLRTAQAIESGESHKDIVEQFEKWALDTEVLASVRSMKQIVKSGRVSRLRGWIARLLGIKPIIAVDNEGKTYLLDKTFTQMGNMKRVVKRIENMVHDRNVWNYIVLHVDNEKGAHWFEKQLKPIMKMEPLAIMDASPVIGANVGHKTVAVIFMFQ